MAGDLVHGALGRGPDAEDGQAARVDLGAAGVGDDLGGDAERVGLGHELVHLLGALGLQGDLGLAVALPALQEPGRGAAGPFGARGLGDGLEARESRVAALRCDLAWRRVSIGRGSCCKGWGRVVSRSARLPFVMPRSVLTTRISLHSSPVSSTEGTKPAFELLVSALGLSPPV